MRQRNTELRNDGDFADGWSLSVVFSPSRGTRTRALRLSDPVITLQRERDGRPNSIALDDQAVSQDCVTLRRLADAPGFELQDTGSRNPVRVNGRLVRRHLLQENDIVRVGNSLLVYDREPPPRLLGSMSSFDTGRLTGLLERLCVFGSSAGQLLQIDASLIPPECRCIILWTPGPTEAQLAAEWLAECREEPLRTIEAADEDALPRVETAGAREVVLLERLDFASPQRIIDLGRRLRDRVEGPVRSLTLLSIPLELRAEPPPIIEQTLAHIAQFELRIPPLAERRADILPALLSRLRADEAHLARSTLTVDFAEHMLCYGWPGELAELKRNALWMSGLIRRGDPLHSSLLPEPMRGGRVQVENDNSVLRVDEEAVLDALREHDGNVSEVAAHFGYSRAYFYRLLRNEGISIRKLRSSLSPRDAAASRAGPDDST